MSAREEPVFCTVVWTYVPQVMALARSLQAVRPGSRLVVLCTDPGSVEALRRLELPGVEVMPSAALERLDPELASVRPSRSGKEYCWTAKASLCRRLLAEGAERVVYLDSDLHFRSSPDPVLDRWGGAVSLMPHRFAPAYAERAAWAGIYNAGWVGFAGDDGGRKAVEWWRRACLEWCFDRAEDGRFGDQKYLDDWPRRFEGVVRVESLAAGVAPWTDNSGLLAGSPPIVPGPDGGRVIFFHYQSLRLQRRRSGAELDWRISGGYDPSEKERALLWKPAADQLIAAAEGLVGAEPRFEALLEPPGRRQRIRERRQRAWIAKERLRARLRWRRGGGDGGGKGRPAGAGGPDDAGRG